MKKKVFIIAIVAVSIAALITIIYLKNTSGATDGNIRTYDTIEEAKEAASFDFQYTDRLAGYPETGYSSNSSTIEITFGKAG